VNRVARRARGLWFRAVRVRRIAGGVLACAGLALSPALARGDGASLYQGPGPRPGPDLLYAAPAVASQLQNSGVWSADPILVSGAGSYRDGEYVYQDFLYDDHGANSGARDPEDPRQGDDTFSMANGTYTYPTAPEYAQNAADLVELRVKPLADANATAFRITLNTMLDPELVGATIAIGGTPGLPVPFPHGANATAPAEMFLTLHGSSADLKNAAGLTLAEYATTVDQDKRQIEVRVPQAAWDPGSSTVRLAAGVGLWDRDAGRYLIPQDAATPERPGGAGVLPAPPAFFNVAFRFGEPLPEVGDPAATATDPAWWRDADQGGELRTGDMSAFSADVDFAKLAAGTRDDSGIPTEGALNRIYASHSETKQGVDFNTDCGSPSKCEGQLRGRLQPYALYVPPGKTPERWGFTPLLHSLGGNYNQYTGSRNQSQFGDRGQGHLIATPTGRGPDGWYYDHAGADTWEMWADVARHYKLDPALTSIAGYSMGGHGTYKFATQFPDLFAKGQPTVGPPGLGVWLPPAPPQPGGEQSNTFRQLASLRHIPFLMWVGSTDQLVPYPGPLEQSRGFDRLGYRYAFDTFSPAEHLTLAINDQYQPAADFLGDARVDRDPAHVTYVRNPKMDFAGLGTTADHAYWLSEVSLRDGGGTAPLGTIDARSAAFGTGDPEANPTQAGAGALTGGNLGTLAFNRSSKTWKDAPKTKAEDVLFVDARNVSTVTVNPQRARLTCAARLSVITDGPVTVNLAGCNRSETFGGGSGATVCASTAGFRSASAKGRGRGVRVNFSRRVSGRVNVDVFRHSAGRRVLGNRQVARFSRRTGSFTWNGRGTRVGDGVYSVRMKIPTGGRGTDVRRIVLERVRGRFRARPAAYRRASCGALTSFKLDLPVFGGSKRRSLGVSYRLGSAARVRLTVLRGNRVVRRYLTRSRLAGRTYRQSVLSRKLRRGTYRVRVVVTRPGAATTTSTLSAKRL